MEAIEDLFSVDTMLGEVDLRWLGVGLSRRQLAQGTVRPGCVVVGQIVGRSRCLRRTEENPDALSREHGVEGLSELPGTIPD
jgi:hypothetical protein